MRRALGGLVALVLLQAAACAESSPEPSSINADVGEVVLVAPDPESAAGTPVIGATPAQEQAARDGLRRLGARSTIRRVVFDGRRLSVELSSRRERDAGDLENEWLANVYLADVVAALARRGIKIERTGIVKSGSRVGTPLTGEPRTARALEALGRAIVERGRRAGLEVRWVEAFQLGMGALKVVVDLDDHDYLAGGHADWSGTVVPDRSERAPFYSAFVLVLAPDGTPIFYGGDYPPDSGKWAFGSRGLTEDAPELPPGKTRLEIELQQAPDGRRASFVLDCEGSSSGFARPRDACKRVVSERYVLFPPQLTLYGCGFGTTESQRSPDRLTVTGTLAGIPVSREYSECTGGDLPRWQDILGVSRF